MSNDNQGNIWVEIHFRNAKIQTFNVICVYNIKSAVREVAAKEPLDEAPWEQYRLASALKTMLFLEPVAPVRSLVNTSVQNT